jgi:hypothetical protein
MNFTNPFLFVQNKLICSFQKKDSMTSTMSDPGARRTTVPHTPKQVLITTPCGKSARPTGAGGSKLRKQKEVVSNHVYNVKNILDHGILIL